MKRILFVLAVVSLVVSSCGMKSNAQGEDTKVKAAVETTVDAEAEKACCDKDAKKEGSCEKDSTACTDAEKKACCEKDSTATEVAKAECEKSCKEKCEKEGEKKEEA